MQGGVERDGEAAQHHEQVGHGQIEQDVVERRAQLLVLHGDVEREGVDGEGSADEEEHVRRQQRVLPRLGQVVLRLLERAAHQTRLVGHGHVEVRTFRSIHVWFTGQGSQWRKQTDEQKRVKHSSAESERERDLLRGTRALLLYAPRVLRLSADERLQ